MINRIFTCKDHGRKNQQINPVLPEIQRWYTLDTKKLAE
jgi:hypothetical protein